MCPQDGKILPMSILGRGTNSPLQSVQRLFEGEASDFCDHVAASGFDYASVGVHLDSECGNDRGVLESLEVVVYALHCSQQLLRFLDFALAEAVQGHPAEFAHSVEQSQNVTPVVRLQFGNRWDALLLGEGPEGHRLDIFLECDDHAR